MKIKCLKWILSLIILPLASLANAGTMWQWTGQIWYQIPPNPSLESTFFYPWPTIVGASSPWSAPKYKLDKRNGYVIWEYIGPTPVGPTQPNPSIHSDSYGSWQAVDNNSNTVKIVSENGLLYQLHDNGRIWAFTNRQWVKIDDNYRTKNIVIASGTLYQLHNNGDIWRYNNSLCNGQGGSSCWTRIDNNRGATIAIIDYNGSLIQLHN